MLQVDLINTFLDSNVIAVTGVSRKKDIPANGIFDKFKKAGYKVYAINPNAQEIDGEKCYPSIAATPEIPEAVFIAAPAEVSSETVDSCISLGINKIWMHRGVGPGSYSKEAEEKCRSNGIQAITNGCPLMFLKPVDPFHRILKWFK